MGVSGQLHAPVQKIKKKKIVTEKVYQEETCEIKPYTYSLTRTVTLTWQTLPPISEDAHDIQNNIFLL
jgi:hypothetical protein